MKQEDKDLLLRDLCARLPYDVKVWVKTHHGQIIESDFLTLCNGVGYYSTISYEGILDDSIVEPYLRPMSSMTEEEEEEYHNLCISPINHHWNITDWLNAHHFDYRKIKNEKGDRKTMIDLGLALPAPEGMYNF